MENNESKPYVAVAGKRYCYNYKRGKCVAKENPLPYDAFTIRHTRIGAKQRCDACLAAAAEAKTQYCINFKSGTCMAAQNPQRLVDFQHRHGRRTSRTCNSCKTSTVKFCSNFQKGKCASTINPQPLENFSHRADRVHLKRSWCRACDHAYGQKNAVVIQTRARQWHQDNREHRRDYNYQKYYGIDLAEYNRLFKVQGGKCAICDIHQSEHEHALVVDHDHITKEVRDCSVINAIEA
jgi:hypothetical protein